MPDTKKDPALCPHCGAPEIHQCHHEGGLLAPECDYWECEECDHQWGHE